MIAHASPSAPGDTSSNITQYNDALASRRFVSVTKWLILEVLSDDSIKCYGPNGLELNYDNVDVIFGDIEKAKTVSVKRGEINDPDTRQEITFEVYNASGISVDQILSESGDSDYIQNFGKPNSFKGTYYYKVPYGEETYYMVGTYDDYDKIVSDGGLVIDGNTIDNKFIGCLQAIRKNGTKYKQVPLREADLICGNLSPIASYSRRVNLLTELTPKIVEITRVEPTPDEPPLVNDAKNVQTNVTKREIAQRILGKLLTECDYFELLSEEAPIVYDSLKQKLKYFTPAFHSMTPEGLNARLTFLQQCMRPGETIQKMSGEYSCDAKNTSFGKPPVCVLRIGDFYHTKIIMNNLNINYEPLVFDLNPEGIGVQPMLAKVNINFKYIGGQGLRRYVDELQTALSFNYYANTDVYDERTFANTDQRERDLINLEQDFFAQNSLDLIPIVKQAELITPSTENLEIPVGTIGIISKRLLPKLAGGTYYNELLYANTYDPSLTYTTGICVTWQDKYYVRNNVKVNQTTQNPEPTDSKYWSKVDHSNFGELAFREEYGRNYIETFEVKYDGIFKELYETFGNYTETLINGSMNDISISENGFELVKLDQQVTSSSVGSKYRVVSEILKNKNYETPLVEIPFDITADSITGTTNETVNGISNINNLDGTTYAELFNKVASSKRYIELGNIFKTNEAFTGNSKLEETKFEAIKLHLHPQEYMFKVGDGLSATYKFTDKVSDSLGNNGMSSKFFPGNITNGYTNNRPDAYSETGGIFFKETRKSNIIYEDILYNLAQEFKTKISLNTLAIWDSSLESSLNTFNNFYTDLDDAHRIIFRRYLTDKFNNYYDVLTKYNERVK